MKYEELVEIFHPLRVRIYSKDSLEFKEFYPFDPLLKLTTWKLYNYDPRSFTFMVG